MLSDTAKNLINLYNANDYIDKEVFLQSKHTIKINQKNFVVDVVYLYKDNYQSTAILKGYAHDDSGNYDYDCLSAQDIANVDLTMYMNDTYIIDFEKFVECLDKNKLLS